jgi:hypothetical protein
LRKRNQNDTETPLSYCSDDDDDDGDDNDDDDDDNDDDDDDDDDDDGDGDDDDDDDDDAADGDDDDDDDDRAAIRLHSALCDGQLATWHAGEQKYTFKQPAHFLSPAPLQLVFAQFVLASMYAVCSAGASISFEMLAAV